MQIGRPAAARPVVVIGMLMTGVFASTAVAQTWQVASGRVAVVCPLTVGGRFEAKTAAVKGQATVTEGETAVAGSFVVDLRTLDTGIGLRNTHLRDNYLEVSRGAGYDTAVLDNIVLDASPPPRGKTATVGFKGVLTLHGRGNPVTGTAEVTYKPDSMDVKVKFPMKIDVYEISRPTYLGVGVSNQIDVEVRATLKVVAPPASSQ